MQGFLQSVLEQLLIQQYSLEKFTYIVPSKRAATFLKKHISSRLKAPIFSPDIYSIEDFISEIAQLKYSTNTELLFTLYASYLKTPITEKDDFNSFLKWGQTLLQDFNEINRYLIEEYELFSYLTSIQKLKHWSVSENKTKLITNYLSFWDNLPSIYENYNSLLLEKKVGYQGLVYRHAYKNIASYLKANSNQDYIFIGFNALNKAESLIIQSFLLKGNSEIYFDIDNYFLKDKSHSASYFIRGYETNWPYFRSNSIKGNSDNYLKPKALNIIGVPKSISQAKYIGSLLKKLDTLGNSLNNTALVLADENLLSPILHSIPNTTSKVNITMGLSIGKSTMANFFESLFNLYTNQHVNGFFHQEILNLLSNPYSSLLFTEDNVDYSKKLKDKINKNNLVYVTAEHIKAITPNINSLIPKLLNSQNGFGSIVEKLRLSIKTLKQKLTIDASDYDLELLYHCYKITNQIINQLNTYSFVTDIKSLKSLFFELLSNETLDFRGDPINGLQIMGMLESRVLDFDTVIIASVNEGILPAGKSNNSFIPYDVKKEFGLPTYREKDAIYTYHFYRLLQRAKNIHLIYNTEPDVLEGGEKSRFINQLLTDENINSSITHTIAAPPTRSNIIKDSSVVKTKELVEELKIVALRGFSPTALSNYIRNPLDFYKKHVLKIDSLQEVEENIAHNTFGTIIHDSLEDLYRPLVSQILTLDILLTLKEKIPAVTKHNFFKMNPSADLTKGKNLIIYSVIKKYLEDFIKTEIEQVKKHKIKILGIEENLSVEIAVPSLNHPIFLRGKLDRVDEIDGQLRIIDYKTGKVASKELEIMDWDSLIDDKKYSKAFQLLCYALMYTQNQNIIPLKAGIVPIKKLSSGVLYFATKSAPRGPKNQHIDNSVLLTFKLQLERLIREIFDPKIPFIEKEE